MFDNLIDNYTDRAAKNMDRKRRDDIRNELRSHILDSAEALAAKKGRAVDEEIIIEVIGKMGPPEEFSSSFAPEKKSILTDRVILAGVAIIVIFFLAVAGLWFVGDQVGNSLAIEHRTDATSHAAAGNVTIDLDDFNGNIDVVESTTGNVEVAYDVYANQGHLGDVITDTTYARDGDTLSVKSSAKLKNTGMITGLHIGFYETGADVVVKVPGGSRYTLDLSTPYGDVTVTPLNGSTLSIESGSGNINVKGGQYDNIAVGTKYGGIKAKYDAADATFTSESGNIDLDSSRMADTLSATTKYGHINARYNANRATFDSSSGNIGLESDLAAESLKATTSYGNIDAKYDAADATFKSDSGNIDLDSGGAADTLSATTKYGHINARYNAANATFKSDSGNIDLDPCQAAENLDARTLYGYIRVLVPENSLFSADAGTSFGRIEHDSIPMILTEADSNHIVGYTKGGPGTLSMKLKSDSGNVEISY